MHRASEIPEILVFEALRLEHGRVRKIVRNAWKRTFGEDCQSCGRHMHFNEKFSDRKNFATIDHIIARALGGDNGPHNIQVICQACNGKKSFEEMASVKVMKGMD